MLKLEGVEVSSCNNRGGTIPCQRPIIVSIITMHDNIHLHTYILIITYSSYITATIYQLFLCTLPFHTLDIQKLI